MVTLRSYLPVLAFIMAFSGAPAGAEDDASGNFAFIYGNHDKQWRSCRSDDDCALIVTAPICTYKLPVNRDSFDKASDYASKHNACAFAPLPDRTGTTYSTTCHAHQCVLKKRLENP